MEFKGRYLITSSPTVVWKALNDPEVLRQCVPGCERIEKTDDTHFIASAVIKIGPIKATFKANLALEDLDPPHRCVIRGEGQGGVAGFARGTAEVVLAPEQNATLLSYTAQATIGGKLAQIGQRLIDGAAKQIADDFFQKFAAVLAAGPVPETGDLPVEPSPAVTPASLSAPDPEPRKGLVPGIWVVGLLALIAILLLLFGVVLGH